MAKWLNLGQTLKVNAGKFADKIALLDSERRLTYSQLNQRVNRLANGITAMGLRKGDKIAVLLENCIEIVEAYLAAAKIGVVIVPINFRLVTDEVAYILDNSDAKALIVHDQFAKTVAPLEEKLFAIPDTRRLMVGQTQAGYRGYDELLASASEDEPQVQVSSKDTWILIYTSGTTGKPKGVLRSHESHIAFYLTNAIDYGFREDDICMNVMPLCHINSTFFSFTFTYLGATVYLHPAMSFRAEEILEIIEREKITFISLIPTHYNLILNAPEAARRKDVASIRKLLCSSAPVRKKTKIAIMDFFPTAELYEAYGSTEAGGVTILKPEDQMRKLGSIGREALGTDEIMLLDSNGNEVGVGEVGELYSRGPALFDAYYKLPEKTEQSHHGEWFSAGDMARRDADGFYYIVDRKDNMIITGGEHVYPSEVEEVVGSHECVFDCACISLPDDKWGEKVVAVVIPQPGVSEDQINAQVIKDCCREKLAGYKQPKEVIFIEQEKMPRTPTGKILHRKLRENFSSTTEEKK